MIDSGELRECINSCDSIDVRDLLKSSKLEFVLDPNSKVGEVMIEMTFDLRAFHDALFRMLDRI